MEPLVTGKGPPFVVDYMYDRCNSHANILEEFLLLQWSTQFRIFTSSEQSRL